MRNIKLIIFDVNQTLFHLKEIEKRFEFIGFDRKYSDIWFSNVLKEGFALGCLNLYKPFREIALEQLKNMLISMNAPSPKKNAKFIINGFLKLQAHNKVLEAFKKVYKKKILMCTLTNGDSGITKKLLKYNKLEKYIDHCFSVNDVKCWKPFKKPYFNVIKHYKIKSSEAIMIASHAWDLTGAKKTGLKTGFVNNFEGGFSNYYPKPDFKAKNISILISKILKN